MPYAMQLVQPIALIVNDGVVLHVAGAEVATHQLLLLHLDLLRGMHVLMVMAQLDVL